MGCLNVALIGLAGLGSRTVCLIAPLHLLVQHQIAPAQRYALPTGLQGTTSVCTCSEMEALVKKFGQTRLTHRPRSGPEPFGAEPVTQAARCVRPCASQARVGLRGRHLGECHFRLASMAKLRVTAGGEKLLSLVTFFAAAKKVTAAPHRGRANRPPRNRDPAKKNPTLQALHNPPQATPHYDP